MAKLRAVGPDDQAPVPPRKLSITQAAESGTVREQLVALRTRIATTVESLDCPPRELAALSTRLIQITKEIEAIDARALEESDGAASTPDEKWQAV
jgi:hypothetical protein